MAALQDLLLNCTSWTLGVFGEEEAVACAAVAAGQEVEGLRSAESTGLGAESK